MKKKNFRQILNECQPSFFIFHSLLSDFCKMEFEFSMFQISAYVDNEFDVAALMEDAETKQAALDQVLGRN